MSIGNSAFYQCYYLESITIPASVTSIGNSAFESWNGLTIKGYRESYAQTFAQKHRIPFEAIAETAAPAVTTALLGDANCDGRLDVAYALAAVKLRRI